MSEIGTAISSSMTFLSKVAEECEALATLLRQELSAALSKRPLDSLYKPEQWSSSYRTDPSGWIYKDAAWSVPLVAKSKPKATSHLAFQISFLCDDPEAGHSPEPLLHINFWDEVTDVSNNSYMGFPMGNIAEPTMQRLRKGTARLFRWETGTNAPDHWTYTLRLADINGLDEIRKLICDLVTKLLIDVDAGEAALDPLESVVVYSAIQDMPDHYRVVL